MRMCKIIGVCPEVRNAHLRALRAQIRDMMAKGKWAQAQSLARRNNIRLG